MSLKSEGLSSEQLTNEPLLVLHTTSNGVALVILPVFKCLIRAEREGGDCVSSRGAPLCFAAALWLRRRRHQMRLCAPPFEVPAVKVPNRTSPGEQKNTISWEMYSIQMATLRRNAARKRPNYREERGDSNVLTSKVVLLQHAG